MPRLVALAHVRTRNIVQQGNPVDPDPTKRHSVTEEVSYLPSQDPEKPTYFDVESEPEAEALIAAGAARAESDHEEFLRLRREAAERGPVPQVTQSAAPVGPGSGATVAPDPNEVARRAATAKPTHELYGGSEDLSGEPLETRHSAPVDRSLSSPEALREGGEQAEPRRRGRPPRE